jgi:Na+-driven multidrug efflux pump
MFYFIGTLANSAAAQAAYALSYGQLFLLVTWSANGLMGASAAVAGQNLGAKQPDRTYAAVNTAARFGFAGAAFFGVFYFFFPAHLLAIFGMTEPEAVAVGVQLLRVLAFSGLFIAVALVYTGGLQGTGDTKSPLYISIISQVAVPIGICFIISSVGTLEPIHIWLAILFGHITRCGLSIFRFLEGKWRYISVDIHTTAGQEKSAH